MAWLYVPSLHCAVAPTGLLSTPAPLPFDEADVAPVVAGVGLGAGATVV